MIGWSNSFYLIPSQQNTQKIQKSSARGDKRGFCTVVNNIIFGKSYDRLGSSSDYINIMGNFFQLKFDVFFRGNFETLEMMEYFKNLSKSRRLTKYEFLVVFILSHGKEDKIACIDGQNVLIEDILELFSDEKCPQMVGKKKIFIVQACRGSMNIVLILLKASLVNNSIILLNRRAMSQ